MYDIMIKSQIQGNERVLNLKYFSVLKIKNFLKSTIKSCYLSDIKNIIDF